jgi:hypothetical protein
MGGRCWRNVLVGNAYGWAPEPEARPTGRPLRSYTQWEYFFSQGERLDKAQVTAKETFVSDIPHRLSFVHE